MSWSEPWNGLTRELELDPRYELNGLIREVELDPHSELDCLYVLVGTLEWYDRGSGTRPS